MFERSTSHHALLGGVARNFVPMQKSTVWLQVLHKESPEKDFSLVKERVYINPTQISTTFLRPGALFQIDKDIFQVTAVGLGWRDADMCYHSTLYGYQVCPNALHIPRKKLMCFQAQLWGSWRCKVVEMGPCTPFVKQYRTTMPGCDWLKKVLASRDATSFGSRLPFYTSHPLASLFCNACLSKRQQRCWALTCDSTCDTFPMDLMSQAACEIAMQRDVSKTDVIDASYWARYADDPLTGEQWRRACDLVRHVTWMFGADHAVDVQSFMRVFPYEREFRMSCLKTIMQGIYRMLRNEDLRTAARRAMQFLFSQLLSAGAQQVEIVLLAHEPVKLRLSFVAVNARLEQLHTFPQSASAMYPGSDEEWLHLVAQCTRARVESAFV